MGHESTARRRAARATLGICATAIFLFATAPAQAVPFHPRKEALDVTGLNHACGAAVDSKGDFYASSAGTSEVKVYNASHTLLTSIVDSNEPCGLAVTSTGVLYVSEKATGEVVQFKPSEYPPTGATTYTETTVDASGKAKGIAVDGFDDGLYVAEGDRVSSYIHELQTVTLTSATGGTFKLKFEGQETTPIPFNASAAEVQTALQALSTIEAGNVEVAKSGEAFSVFFVGKFAYTDVAGGLSADATSLTAANPKILVSEASKGFSGQIGEGTLTEATGVAAFSFTYSNPSHSGTEHFLWVADAQGILKDQLYLFRSQNANALELRRTLDGATTPDGSFSFGAAGASLAEDPGNRNSAGKCKVVGEPQACTAGHLFLYDSAHKALDEFDASGEYLDQTRNAGFADAEPSAIAIDRSGGSNDGTVYLTAGPGGAAKALAFGPLKGPSRKALKEPSEEAGGLSHKLITINAVATDSHGDVYAAAGESIRIYSPSGAEITKFTDAGKPIEVAVDSTGVVYVVDEPVSEETEVTYYTPTPGKYPPDGTTTYTRRATPIITGPECPGVAKYVTTVAVNPGPGPGKDHLFVLCADVILLYDSAANESTLLNGEFGKGLMGGVHRESIAVNGATGTVYVGENSNGGGLITAVDEAGEELVGRFEDTGFTSGAFGGGPSLAVDQSSGHVFEFDGVNHSAREYDAAGAFVAEFGKFTEGLQSVRWGVAIDNACALHEPPLNETTNPTCHAYDPANGTAYVAFPDTSTTAHPPYKGINAFAPLKYDSTPAKHKVTVAKTGNGSGTVISTPAGISCGLTCTAEFEETEVVTLEAQAAAQSEFSGWTGCEAELSPTKCEVTPSKDREVSAHFEHELGTEFPLEVVFEGPGSGEVSSTPEGIECTSTCSAQFPEATVVTLEAKAPQGSEFLSWTGCEAEPSSGKCEVTMSGAKQVKVKFGIEHPELSVLEEGNGTGQVTSSPPGIDCKPTCTHKFDLDEEVTLSAEADPGSVFEGWEGCDAEPSPSECEVQMDEAREVKATFSALPAITAEPAHPILYTEATLNAEIDPVGLETEYRFEYIDRQSFEEQGGFEGPATKHTATAELKAGEAPVPVSANLFGLREGTEYLFRAVAKNAVGRAAGESVSFVTQARRGAEECPNALYRFGLSANLPDCRAYELITPAQTDGLKPYAASYGGGASRGLNDWLTVQRGAGAGELLTYFTDGTLPGFEGNGVTDGYRAKRGTGDHPAAGWQSEIFSPNYEEAAPSLLKTPNQLGVTPDQLYSAWEIVDGVETFPGTLPSGTYLRTPAGFEALGQGSLGTDLEALRRYLSSGGEHVIVVSSQHLEEKAAPQGTAAIYDREAGQSSSEVISVKPGGAAFGAGEAASYAGASEDGSAVAFSVGGALYLHRGGQTFAIATSPATFAGISDDGKRVFYAASGSGESPAAISTCDTETGPCAGAGSHSATKLASAGIFTMISPDGSRAFFSSTEALTGAEENDNGEEAEAGKRNLYAWDGAGTRFLGQLSAADFANGSFDGIAGMSLGVWTRAIGVGGQPGRAYAPTRSTPGGGSFVFQSHARLSAYDNKGKGEIYRYDPAAEEGQRLICVSCDPSGAPPKADALLEDIGAVQNVPVQPETMIANLSEDGSEIFFQSFDRLLPEDANKVEDVYEWKAKGSGGCERPGGCLALISSGQGEVPSFLYAMSADGHDVFFQTKEKLVGSDEAGSPSIYDARVGGGIPEPIEAAPCQGDACQGQGALPPKLPAPASTGSGEAPGGGEAPASSRCAKGKHRVKGRCVVAKHHKRNAKKHARRANAKRGGRR